MKTFFENPRYYQFPEPTSDSFLTNNNVLSELLVLYKSEDMVDSGRDLLTNILKAIDFEMEKVHMIKIIHTSGFSFHMIKRTYNLRYVLSFGLQPVELGFKGHLKYYRLYHFERFDIIFSNTLVTLSKDQHKKKMLWKVLKAKFIDRKM